VPAVVVLSHFGVDKDGATVKIHIAYPQVNDFLRAQETRIYQFAYKKHLRLILSKIIGNGFPGLCIYYHTFLVCFLLGLDVLERIAGHIAVLDTPVEETAAEFQVVVVASLADLPVEIYILHETRGVLLVEQTEVLEVGTPGVEIRNEGIEERFV